MDEVSMLTAIPLFLLSASSELVGVVVLQKGCIDRFRNALNSSDPWVSRMCKLGWSGKYTPKGCRVISQCFKRHRWRSECWRVWFLVVAGSGAVLPAAAVGVSTRQPRPLHAVHPRLGSAHGGEVKGGGTQSARHRRGAAGCAGGHQGPGESGQHGRREES